MDILNSIGFCNFWGVTPFINLFETGKEILKDPSTKEINILLSNSNDLRHIIFTLYNLFISQNKKKIKYPLINFYIHETHKENLCRNLLLFHLICDREKSIIERVEMIMEIYGNTLLPSRTIDYINIVYKLLINFITNDLKKFTPIYKNLIDLSCLTHKEIDEMVEIYQSYDSKFPYDIEKYRNDRIRFALKDRYDYRRNMYDWDYNMNLQKYAPIVRLQHYMYWRENGVAFVMRLNEYKQPNRTLANYIEGRNKINKDSCMVRGFWGDIVNSPYISYGLELETKDEIDYFYQNNKINYLRDAQDVTEYNLVKFLLRLDHNENYDFMKREKEKEKMRREKIEKDEAEKAKKIKEEEEKNKKLEKIKEENEEENENEINTDSEETKKKKEIEKMKKEAERIKEEDKNILINNNNKNPLEEISKKVAENMKNEKEETTEESLINATSKNNNESKTNELLQAFKEVNFKIHFVSGDIEKSIYKKKKFKNYFDVVLYGFHASTKFSEKQKDIIKNSTRILFEMNSHMASFTDKQRKEFTDNLIKMCKEKGFILDDTSFKFMYQFKLNVNNNNSENNNENNIENNNENEISTTSETTTNSKNN